MKMRTAGASPQRSRRSLETALRKKAVAMLGQSTITLEVDEAWNLPKGALVEIDDVIYRVTARSGHSVTAEPV